MSLTGFVDQSCFPVGAGAQGSLCLSRLCPLPGKDVRRVGGLKCHKNAVKMKATSKNAGKVGLDSALDDSGGSW